MIEPLFRSCRTNRPFAIVLAMLAGMTFVLIAIRIAERGVAFGRWLAVLAR